MTANGERVESLFVYCAAGMRYPMEKVSKDYEEEFGTRIQLQYGGSNTLLSQLEVSQTGDLYLAADDSYISLARDKGLLAAGIYGENPRLYPAALHEAVQANPPAEKYARTEGVYREWTEACKGHATPGPSFPGHSARPTALVLPCTLPPPTPAVLPWASRGASLRRSSCQECAPPFGATRATTCSWNAAMPTASP